MDSCVHETITLPGKTGIFENSGILQFEYRSTGVSHPSILPVSIYGVYRSFGLLRNIDRAHSLSFNLLKNEACTLFQRMLDALTA